MVFLRLISFLKDYIFVIISIPLPPNSSDGLLSQIYVSSISSINLNSSGEYSFLPRSRIIVSGKKWDELKSSLKCSFSYYKKVLAIPTFVQILS